MEQRHESEWERRRILEAYVDKTVRVKEYWGGKRIEFAEGFRERAASQLISLYEQLWGKKEYSLARVGGAKWS